MTRLAILVTLTVLALVLALVLRRDPPDTVAVVAPAALPADVGELGPASFELAPTTTTVVAQLEAAQPIPEEASAPPPPPAPRTVATIAPASGDMADIVRNGFARFGPDIAEQAVRVATCESTLRPWVTNAGSVGLLQINVPSHLARIARLGFTPADMTDPVDNVAVAADLYGDSGWQPWACRWAA